MGAAEKHPAAQGLLLPIPGSLPLSGARGVLLTVVLNSISASPPQYHNAVKICPGKLWVSIPGNFCSTAALRARLETAEGQAERVGAWRVYSRALHKVQPHM